MNAAIHINPLSNAKGSAFNKGISRSCELCGRTAEEEHRDADFRGIHALICNLLVPLRSPVTVLGSEEERIERKVHVRKQQADLLAIAKSRAQKLLFEGNFDLAIPAALQALRFSLLVYSQESIELVPAYLLLGEASIGLSQYKQAEDYLSLAKWAVLKSNTKDNHIKSQLHRNFGQLYAAKGEYELAKDELAQDKIYLVSTVNGPEHISVTGGYYQLGRVFHKLDRDDDATAFFDKALGIWQEAIKNESAEFDVTRVAEGVQMLKYINQFRLQRTTQIAATEALYLLAQVYHRSGQLDKARDSGSKALEIYEAALGREHSLTKDVRTFVKNSGILAPRKPSSI